MADPHGTGAPAQSEPVAEYEREPVPERAWLGFRSFVGQYAGEHTAGTELMIGPLFVASGVSAVDVVGGPAAWATCWPCSAGPSSRPRSPRARG